jgi:hypothetical protein
MQRHKIVQKWREHFRDQAIAQQIPLLSKVRFEIYTTFATRALQDPGNNMPAVKAAIDGLVDAGVIPNDIPEHVASITFHAPTYEKGVDSVCLLIVEVDDNDLSSDVQ